MGSQPLPGKETAYLSPPAACYLPLTIPCLLLYTTTYYYLLITASTDGTACWSLLHLTRTTTYYYLLFTTSIDGTAEPTVALDAYYDLLLLATYYKYRRNC